MKKEELLQQIADLKVLNFGEYGIDCNFGDLKYRLVFLTENAINNLEIMNLLFVWRKNNLSWFQAQFNITLEGTVRWFKDRVVGAPDRLLFIIKVGDEYVGHVGLFRFDFSNFSCEIDNIVRGEKKYPGIIGDAILNMMKWGQSFLGVENYTLETFSDNLRALKLYENLGFKEYNRKPLIKIQNEDRAEWVSPGTDYQGAIERFNVFMRFNKTI